MLNEASTFGVRFLSSRSFSAARTFLLVSFSFLTLAATSDPFLILKSLPALRKGRFSRFCGLICCFCGLICFFCDLVDWSVATAGGQTNIPPVKAIRTTTQIAVRFASSLISKPSFEKLANIVERNNVGNYCTLPKRRLSLTGSLVFSDRPALRSDAQRSRV